MRKGRPFVLANMKTGEGLEAIIAFMRHKGGLKFGPGATRAETTGR